MKFALPIAALLQTACTVGVGDLRGFLKLKPVPFDQVFVSDNAGGRRDTGRREHNPKGQQ